MLNQADRQVVYTLFPALQQEFGFSDAVLGLTGALFLWVYGICSPLSGILGDRWSKTHLVVGSLVLWSFFTVASGLSPNGTFLLACRALLGISESLYMPAAYALMANAHGPATRSKAVAIFATSQMVGVAVGRLTQRICRRAAALASVVLDARLCRPFVRISPVSILPDDPRGVQNGKCQSATASRVQRASSNCFESRRCGSSRSLSRFPPSVCISSTPGCRPSSTTSSAWDSHAPALKRVSILRSARWWV